MHTHNYMHIPPISQGLGITGSPRSWVYRFPYLHTLPREDMGASALFAPEQCSTPRWLTARQKALHEVSHAYPTLSATSWVQAVPNVPWTEVIVPWGDLQQCQAMSNCCSLQCNVSHHYKLSSFQANWSILSLLDSLSFKFPDYSLFWLMVIILFVMLTFWQNALQNVLCISSRHTVLTHILPSAFFQITCQGWSMETPPKHPGCFIFTLRTSCRSFEKRMKRIFSA